ncbi:hypothetical protein PoB_005021900 [Plakobranchus ocellatus]|uniref:Uncharacterized protein n=1 Tax=Plakobranchus ocellatus TaxID=259542 RepID=A0AAV4BZ93_9GAST|nr:hypothetical protein PoB_005021900 [Plakobranchus ocellatus]
MKRGVQAYVEKLFGRSEVECGTEGINKKMRRGQIKSLARARWEHVQLLTKQFTCKELLSDLENISDTGVENSTDKATDEKRPDVF